MTDEAEPFMGSGRFGKLISLAFFLLVLFLTLVRSVLEHSSHNDVSLILTARAYVLGYNCADEKELEATLRFC